MAGALPPATRLSSKESKEQDNEGRTKSELNLMDGHHSTSFHSNPSSTQSERSLLERESSDKFEEDGDNLNAIALAKPTMAPGRRRPSMAMNLKAGIPPENRLTEAEIVAATQETTKVSEGVLGMKRQQEAAALLVPPSDRELTPGEQWLLSRMVAMQNDLLDRIALLEQEAVVLRQALITGGITVPQTAAPPPTSASSTPQAPVTKKIPTAMNLNPTLPSSPGPVRTTMAPPAVKRTDSSDSTSSITKAVPSSPLIKRNDSSESSSRNIIPDPSSPTRTLKREVSDSANVDRMGSPTAAKKAPSRLVPAPPTRTSSVSDVNKAATTPYESVVEGTPLPVGQEKATAAESDVVTHATVESQAETDVQTSPTTEVANENAPTLPESTGTTKPEKAHEDDEDDDGVDML
jgi:hypothetical protein